MENMEEPKSLLKISNLKTYFFTDAGVVKAVDRVDLNIVEGETLGLVGESGCGKRLRNGCCGSWGW